MKAALGLLVCLTGLALPGCLPGEMPSYTPDGKQVVFVAGGPGSKTDALWVYDLQRKTAAPYLPTDRWAIVAAQWTGGQLWVQCSRDEKAPEDEKASAAAIGKAAGRPTREKEFIWLRFDLPTERFVKGEGFSRLADAIAPLPAPFIAGFKGKPMLFVSMVKDKDTSRDVFPFSIYDPAGAGNSAAAVIKVARTEPAGRAWSLRCTERDPYKGEGTFEGLTRELVAVEVYDDKGRKTCTIAGDTIAPICHRGNARFPTYARVSDDASVILLAFDTKTIFRGHPNKYTFGVFDTKSGKLLWSGVSDSMRGTPLVTRQAVWTLEEVGRKAYTGEQTPAALVAGPQEAPHDDAFRLVRRLPGKQPTEAGPCDEVLVRKLGQGDWVEEFAPDPKRENFLVAVTGNQPQLLVVPIRESVKPEEVVVLELRAPGVGSASQPAAASQPHP
jgi:hypothetical protein